MYELLTLESRSLMSLIWIYTSGLMENDQKCQAIYCLALTIVCASRPFIKKLSLPLRVYFYLYRGVSKMKEATRFLSVIANKEYFLNASTFRIMIATFRSLLFWKWSNDSHTKSYRLKSCEISRTSLHTYRGHYTLYINFFITV